MRWIKKTDKTKIADIVSYNTGIPADTLRFDETHYCYPGLDEACDLFLCRAQAGGTIAMHGDYDCDGIMSLEQDKNFLPALHVTDCIIYPPKRFSDGFGVKERHIDYYHEKGVKLLVLQDNGIAAVEPVAKARAYGMDVIILDHHIPPTDKTGAYILPDANVIVDPHVTGGDFDDLCGAGITFRFALRLIEKCPWMSHEYKWALRKKLACFAAIGTIGDVVSLTGDNRLIVKEGIEAINRGFASAGLKTLLKETNTEYLTSVGIAFGVVPAINAYGRLEDDGPRSILNLLAATEESPELDSMCRLAVSKNTERKRLEKDALERAKFLMAGHEDDNFLVILDEGCTIGIAGLVAGKLTEQYGRPSIVLAPIHDGLVKGSGRSVKGINILELLDKNAELIETYGGHDGACGITLSRDKLAEFTAAVNRDAPAPKTIDTIYYDADADIAGIEPLLKEIDTYQPYGAGNPELIVRFDNVPVKDAFLMGNGREHIKLINKHASVIWFNGAAAYAKMGKPKYIDVLGKVAFNEYKGKLSIQIQAVDVRPSA